MMNLKLLTDHLKVLFSDEADLKDVSYSALKLEMALKGHGRWCKEISLENIQELREQVTQLLEDRGYGLVKMKDAVCGVAYFGGDFDDN